jgi:hypothetical protein
LKSAIKRRSRRRITLIRRRILKMIMLRRRRRRRMQGPLSSRQPGRLFTARSTFLAFNLHTL